MSHSNNNNTNNNTNVSRKRSASDAEIIDTNKPSKIQKIDVNNSHNSHNSHNKTYNGLEAYEKIDKLGEGTYGIVYLARDRRDNSYVALKRVRTGLNDNKNGFPITSIREIKILQNLYHQNIVKLLRVVRSVNIGYVFLVFPYYQHDLAQLIDSNNKPFNISEIKCILRQILSAINYSHSHYVIHRDIKLSNILLNNCGNIVIADWGLARLYSHPLSEHTQSVVTLWYRAPELLFGNKIYHTSIDIWAIGCIFAELLQNIPLLPGKNELNQIQLIFKLLGKPNNNIWPNYTRLPKINNNTYNMNDFNDNIYKYNQIDTIFAKYKANCLDLMKQFLAYDPAKRITAKNALKHQYFKEMPLPCTPNMMPTFPTKINIK